MPETKSEFEPPELKTDSEGAIDPVSLADLLEWFLNYDQKVAIVRHPHVEELFQWKQKADEERGVQSYPFDNAESRFAVGVSQAITANDSEEKLRQWMTDVLQALGEAKQLNEDIAKDFKLAQDRSHVEEAEKLPSHDQKQFYLSSCWIESLCTAEVRFLGWIYQELYGKPFEPAEVTRPED
ncbi:MAG: hypothetical protein DWQ47_07845 [Acidobacteria bacterium]|nr:MAG: hypothetical protein DWQ32_15945 [Acidobacteriota bacterium]REJ99170.1 MAG: hypothetical protein DWQ38_14030 [Acidobacteriota bacterium]REK16109.1 MAG: hypothetical protein DWQ43_03655 [Acidobacteriota bacterium]REK43790.1 MAG: hypothetical protein DWQ47_07845 [Acidobacteriota bacterium]